MIIDAFLNVQVDMVGQINLLPTIPVEGIMIVVLERNAIMVIVFQLVTRTVIVQVVPIIVILTKEYALKSLFVMERMNVQDTIGALETLVQGLQFALFKVIVSPIKCVLEETAFPPVNLQMIVLSRLAVIMDFVEMFPSEDTVIVQSL